MRVRRLKFRLCRRLLSSLVLLLLSFTDRASRLQPHSKHSSRRPLATQQQQQPHCHCGCQPQPRRSSDRWPTSTIPVSHNSEDLNSRDCSCSDRCSQPSGSPRGTLPLFSGASWPVRLLGQGAFGKVYLVSRRRDGVQFVQKNIPINGVWNKAIETEVRLLSELEHPGVVRFIESFIDRDKHHMCIVMGYCEGGDLGAYIKHKKGIPMRETEVLYHFVQMALALLYMHEKMILHRDLKTQNIFIKNGLIQLGDFGISKALTGSNDFAQSWYMSPELFQNKPYNNKSDVWALGCVLYELMTYKHAFDAQSIASLAGKVLKGVFTALPATYPKAMRTLVKDMLQLDPKARPSMHQILTLPFLRKHIKTYVNAVMNAQHMYRPRDLENFKAQLRRLHMEDMLEPAPGNPVPPLALGQAAHRSLYCALREEHARKWHQEREAREKALRLKEADEMRAAEKARAAEAARLAEAERVENRRKQLELAQQRQQKQPTIIQFFPPVQYRVPQPYSLYPPAQPVIQRIVHVGPVPFGAQFQPPPPFGVVMHIRPPVLCGPVNMGPGLCVMPNIYNGMVPVRDVLSG